ncbi:hypothetical protein BD560DRAFT_470271, partial [Blakeslea trispora]
TSNDGHIDPPTLSGCSSHLHSLDVRPTYNWTPSVHLNNALSLEAPLFTSPSLPEEERRKVIKRYPRIEGLQYQPPETPPLAARKMLRSQNKQDMSLKRLQYLLSGALRPLDILGLEISQDVENDNTQRYLYMLHDCRQLLLNLSSQMNDMRINLAYQAINPTFSSTNSNSSSSYTISPTEFQVGLSQQTAANQAVQNASKFRNKRKTFQNNNNLQQSGFQPQPQQFFRSGPSSQQGGYNPTNGNNFTQQQTQQTYRRFNKKQSNTNPFRTNQQ